MVYENCGVKVIVNKNEKLCYFYNGRRVCRKIGDIYIQMVEEYLRPTKKLESYFKRGNFNLCNLGLPDLQFKKVITNKDKGSASNSIIVMATAMSEDVVAKITFEENNKSFDNSLAVEAHFYEHVIPKLKIFTPNLMTFLGNGSCKNFIDTLSYMRNRGQPFAKELSIETDIIHKGDRNKKYDFNTANLLVTKKAGGKELSKWLETEWHGWNQVEREHFISDVLLQIAYTLTVFEDVGIIHNDLHSGNVFVEQLDTPLNLSFGITDKKTVSRNVSFFVRIFDFDHSAKIATIHWDYIVHNNLLSSFLCKSVGECNEFRRNADWFTVLHFMYAIVKYKPIETIIRSDLLNLRTQQKDPITGRPIKNNFKLLAHMGHACQCENNSCDTCKPINLDDPSLVVSPVIFIEKHFNITKCTPYFKRPAFGIPIR